jgi:hypothetical protein
MRHAPCTAALLILGSLAACSREARVAADSTATAAADTAAATAAAAQATGDLASSRTFNSLLANFQFAVPDVWEQRYTATERINPADYPKAKSVAEFLFLPLSGGTPPVLLALVQYSEADWKALGAGAAGTVVSDSGGRVFTAVLLKANPFPAGSEDGTAIAPMMLTVEQVRKALRT